MAIHGRGAQSAKVPTRFGLATREADGDWLDAREDIDGPGPKLRTTVTEEHPRSILTFNRSPDIPFDRSVNAYRGCEHGCVYCYARPTHSYLNLSPGLDFETRLIAKRNVAEVLRHELLAASYRPDLLAIGTVTDAYQPIERELRLTRAVLQVLATAKHPLAMVTKGSGVERDLDLLAPMGAQRLAAVYVTVTTLDSKLARVLEPRAAAPHRRLRTIRTLAEAGVPVGVSVSPQIPFINDDMEHVLAAAWDDGARRAFYQVLRLPWELAPMFRDWLALHYPDRAARVMARMQDLRGGKDYDAHFATRMRGQGIWADLIHQRFVTTCDRLGFNRDREPLDLSRFRPAALRGQRDLFG